MVSVVISGLVLVSFGSIVWTLLYRENLNAIDRKLSAMGDRQMEHIIRSRNLEEFNQAFGFVFGEQENQETIVWFRRGPQETIYRSPHWPAQLDLTEFSALNLGDVTPTGREGLDEGILGPPPLLPRRPPGRRPDRFRRGGFEETPIRGRPGFEVTKILTIESSEESWRIAYMSGRRMEAFIGLNLNEFRGEINRMRNSFLIALPAALFLIGWGGLQISRRALKPIETLTAIVENVTAKGLKQRIPAAQDVSEFDRLTEVFNGMLNRLERSFHQANRFTADASHELQTPLTIIQGELESAMVKAPTNSDIQKTFRGLLEEVHRLKSIIKSLLLLSKADSGDLRLCTTPFNFSQIVENCFEDAQILVESRRIRLTASIEKDTWVEGDEALLHQVVQNLVSNAVKYNQDKGEIRFNLESKDEQINFTLMNSGEIIPAEHHERIFDRFYREDKSRTRLVDGFGLGLSLAREIARTHGGDLVLVQSTEECTAFTLALRKIPPPETEAALSFG
jgi:signal transduction histidine kinase